MRDGQKGEQILLSVTNTAQRLGVGKTTVWKFIRLGELKVVRLGRRTLVVGDSISDLIDRS